MNTILSILILLLTLFVIVGISYLFIFHPFNDMNNACWPTYHEYSLIGNISQIDSMPNCWVIYGYGTEEQPFIYKCLEYRC